MNILKVMISVGLCAVVFTLSGCVHASKQSLIMATNAEFPPYEYYDENNNIVGIDVEIAQAIADELGCKLEIIDMDFGSIIPAIVNGKADIAVAALSVTEEKLEQINFSEPYATASQLIIVQEGSSISSVSDLSGKRIGVQIYTTGEVYASDIEDTTIERYNKGSDAVDALIAGDIDAVVIDGEPAKVFVEENAGLVMIDEPLTEEEYAIGVSKDNSRLLKNVNSAIESLKQSGKLDRIMEKYIKAE